MFDHFRIHRESYLTAIIVGSVLFIALADYLRWEIRDTLILIVIGVAVSILGLGSALFVLALLAGFLRRGRQ